MKKTMICMLLIGCVCLSLCGCGGMSTGRDNAVVETPLIPNNSPDLNPEILPMETPNAEDGIVNDRDGLIDEGDTGANHNTGVETPREGILSSPSPEHSSAP